MVSLVLVGLWMIGVIWGDTWPTAGLLVHPLAAISAGVTALVTLPMYLWGKEAHMKWLSFTSYMLMLFTTTSIIYTTGSEQSPFIVLWMLLTIFSGLFGYPALIIIFLFDALYPIAIALNLPMLLQNSQNFNAPLFIMTSVLPLFISFMIWRRKSEHDTSSEKYMALARELSQVADKSEIVINSIADGVIALDHRGTIQLINPAAQTIMGWGKQDAMELDYRSVFKVTDSEDKPLDETTDPILQVLNTGKPVKRNDLSLATSTGKKMIISLSISPVGQQGSGAIIVFRDITNDVAENRQKAEFISTASHEMRTPVAAIEGYLGLALNPATATIDEKARSFLTKAHESAQHLGHLFQDLLDVSKAEDGRLGNTPTTIDVTAFVRDVVNSLMATAFSKEITLVFEPDVVTQGNAMTPIYYVRADQSHYREILSNLVENSIKYTKNGGKVAVDISGDDAHVTVSVVDNGIGIPKEDIPHLFQKFYRVDNTDTREIGGTGLGLYLCRRLAEAMDGRIWVESDYGKGSMFFIELPRLSADEALKPSAIPAVSPVSIPMTPPPVAPVAPPELAPVAESSPPPQT